MENSFEKINKEEKLKKDKNLEKIREKMDKVEDALAEKIDEGIKDTVVMFNALGFRTEQSCEGHPDQEHGFSFPWVEFGPEKPQEDGWFEDEELRQEIIEKMLKQKQKMLDLLSEFYEDRDTEYENMLSMKQIAYSLRLQSNVGRALEILPEEKLNKKADLLKKEMDDFTEFLKEKYYNK